MNFSITNAPFAHRLIVANNFGNYFGGESVLKAVLGSEFECVAINNDAAPIEMGLDQILASCMQVADYIQSLPAVKQTFKPPQNRTVGGVEHEVYPLEIQQALIFKNPKEEGYLLCLSKVNEYWQMHDEKLSRLDLDEETLPPLAWPLTAEDAAQVSAFFGVQIKPIPADNLTDSAKKAQQLIMKVILATAVNQTEAIKAFVAPGLNGRLVTFCKDEIEEVSYASSSEFADILGTYASKNIDVKEFAFGFEASETNGEETTLKLKYKVVNLIRENDQILERTVSGIEQWTYDAQQGVLTAVNILNKTILDQEYVKKETAQPLTSRSCVLL